MYNWFKSIISFFHDATSTLKILPFFIDNGNKKPFIDFFFLNTEPLQQTNKAAFMMSKKQSFPSELNERIQL